MNTQSAKRICFTDLDVIQRLETPVRACIDAAVAVEKAGLKVEFKQTDDLPVSEEFQQKLNEIPALRNAFEALTPGRQRAYLLHFSTAKQAKTRSARVEKHLKRILDGLGLND